MNIIDYKSFKKILLFFSGGLDTSFLLKWFTKEVGAEIITVSFDLGGDKIEIEKIDKRAKLLGSRKHFFIDAKKEFIEEYCWNAIKANAIFEGAHPLSSSLSRPLMSKLGVELAQKYDCCAILHGSNGWQNNSARFDTSIRVLSDKIEILEPIMENNLSREFEYEYLKHQGVEITVKEDNLLSSDNNLWGREVEDGILEFPDKEPQEEIYRITSSIELTPNTPEYIDLEFKNGIPKNLNGQELNSVELVEILNKLGGKHGIGRHDAMEDKIIGFKMREIHESPAATILIMAHKDLESTVTQRKTLSIKNFIDAEWTELACFGQWYHPLRKHLELFIDSVNERVSGNVRLKLFKGRAQVVGRFSEHGVYQENFKEKIKNIYKRSPHPNRNFYDYYSYEAKIAELTN